MAAGPLSKKTISRQSQSSQRIGLWIWLIAPVTTLVASLLLEDAGGRRVLIKFLGTQLPESCTMYARLGINCPGCGLTRSFINLSAGNWLEALRLNPLGIVCYLYTAAQIPLSGSLLLPSGLRRRIYAKATERRWIWLNQWGFVGLMIALIVQWILRITWIGF